MAVEAIGRPAVIRQVTSVSQSVAVASVYGMDQQDALEGIRSGQRQLAWVNTASNAALFGPVLNDSLEVDAPYTEIVTAQGTLPSANAWYLGRATPFEFDNTASNRQYTPTGSYDTALLVIQPLGCWGWTDRDMGRFEGHTD